MRNLSLLLRKNAAVSIDWGIAKAEIAALRSGKTLEYPDGVSPKKKQIAAYLRENPGVSNKSYIARELGIDVSTVRKYYDEVRAELAALAVS